MKDESYYSPSLFEKMFINKENMISLLLKDILPSLTDAKKGDCHESG